jgi:hypothetical protein
VSIATTNTYTDFDLETKAQIRAICEFTRLILGARLDSGPVIRRTTTALTYA